MADPAARTPHRRNDASFLLSTIVTALFFALVLVMAFRPRWLSADVSPEGIEAPALVLTFALLLLTIGAMGLFCWLRAQGDRGDQ